METYGFNGTIPLTPITDPNSIWIWIIPLMLMGVGMLIMYLGYKWSEWKKKK
jgi:cytochrome c-type biogenesis protein CcmH/NrfF